MAYRKSHLYSERDQIISAFAKALGHPARVVIIRKLTAEGSCCVEQLLKEHPLSQPTLSGHISQLLSSKLIKYKEKFPRTYYRLDAKNIALAKEYLGGFFNNF
jgi:ArsR family transcriptional regulator